MLMNSFPHDGRVALQKEDELVSIDLPILKDDSQLVAKQLGANRTAEAILIDTKTWNIRYRGPIDNRITDYGQVARNPTAHYLADALNAVLNDEDVPVIARPTIGCVISLNGERKQTVSYADDVVPILRQKCMICHRPNDVAPWSMDNYEAIKGWTPMMREVIMTKRMPPWHADPGIGEFFPDRHLTPAEQRTLIDWIDAGAPRGDQPDPLVHTPPLPAEEWPLGKPDLVLTAPKQAIPSTGNVEYRYVTLQVPIDSDKWVRAVQIKPSNRAVLHHAVALVQYPNRLKDPEPMDALASYFAVSGPGLQPYPLPEGSGQFLPAGSTFFLQLHYVAVGYPAEDEPKLALYFHEQPPKLEHVVASALNTKFRILPYDAHHVEFAETTVPENALLRSLFPHMHYRGSEWRFTARYPDGREEILLSVPNFNFNWQTVYQLKHPKRLPAGTKILVKAVFDNSEQNPLNPDPSKMVKWGPRSNDEMVLGYFAYTRPRVAETPDEIAAHNAKMTGAPPPSAGTASSQVRPQVIGP